MVYGNKEFYQLSDVIFGLRVEYQKVQRKLESLKEYARVDSEYENLTFSFNPQTKKLVYDCTLKHNRLDRIFSSTLFGANVKKKKGIYCSDEVLTIMDSKIFGKIAKNILDDNFCDGIEFSTKFSNRNNSNQVVEMNIYSGSIHIYLDNLSKLKSSITMSYYATGDMISVNKKLGVLTKGDIYDILNVKFPGDMLSNYYIDLIDYANNNKSVELRMSKGFRTNCDLDIIEESDKLILQKKKRNL